jgi:hypothetical protein
MAKHTVKKDGNSLSTKTAIIIKTIRKNNQLKTNTTLQMESAKIEFKVI